MVRLLRYIRTEFGEVRSAPLGAVCIGIWHI